MSEDPESNSPPTDTTDCTPCTPSRRFSEQPVRHEISRATAANASFGSPAMKHRNEEAPSGSATMVGGGSMAGAAATAAAAATGSTPSKQRKDQGEKRFACSQCPKRFPTSKDLKRHDVVHTGNREFQCTFCSHRFGRKVIYGPIWAMLKVDGLRYFGGFFVH